MNRRLNCIADHVALGTGLIDVGTDHGYLPLELIRRHYPGKLYASDINPGPLNAARHSAEAAGLSDRIGFLLCDGLDACPPDRIDTIVIAGMGGDTICGILDRAEWCMDSRYSLVLQPMTRAEVLRYWLIYNEFEITAEDLVEDSGILYSVLTARYGGHTCLKDAELYTGSYSMLRDHALFSAFLNGQIQRFERALQGLRASEKCNENGRIEILSQILKQLEEMKHDGNS